MLKCNESRRGASSNYLEEKMPTKKLEATSHFDRTGNPRLLGTAVLFLSAVLFPVAVAAATLDRDSDPVVLSGTSIAAFTGVAPGDVVAFRWSGSWQQIPVQVDEKDQVEFARVYGFYDTATNPTGSAQGALGVFAEQYTDSGTFTGPDSDPSVDADDEIVFMAKDAGDRPSEFSEPAGVVSNSGVQVQIDDPLDGGFAYVYLFESAGGLDPSAGQQYVTYDFDLLSGDYKTTYLLNGGPGTSHGPQVNAEDSTITTAYYERHWSFRWTNDDLAIFAGGASGVDILEKRDYWIAPGSCGRHNATFNAQEGAFFANIQGPVRAIRSYMGSNSGPLTQSEHIYYERREDTVNFARVHSRPATGIVYADLNANAIGMTYADSSNTAGVTIDGVPDVVTPGPLSWEVVTGTPGSLVSVSSFDTDIPNYFDGVTSYYQDESNTGTNICQECEEAPTAVCPSVVIISDDDLIGAHGQWGTNPLPNTDPRNPPFNNLSVTGVTYYEGPGLTAADAAERRAWFDDPLQTTVTSWSGGTGCPATPLVGCRTAQKSTLVYRDNIFDDKDRLTYKWSNGQATSQADFADPEFTAQYDLCIFGGPGAGLFVESNVLPDAEKWEPVSTRGYKYKDKLLTEDGTQKISLRGSDADKAKINWKGKGFGLPDVSPGSLPLVPAAFPVWVQILNSDTQVCFETSFEIEDVSTNLDDKLKLKQK
jgi:hypothetical protein